MITWKQQLEIESVCDEFEQTLRNDSPAAIEDFLPRVASSCQTSLFRELLTLELTYRKKRDEQISIADYLNRFALEHQIVNDVFRALNTFPDNESISVAGDQTDEDFSARHLDNRSPIIADTKIDNYTILREIGQGGMGTIYLAQDQASMRLVAMKFVRQDRVESAEYKNLRRRFENEFQAAATLNHENIVPVFAIGEFQGQPYYVMPFLNQENLEKRIQRHPIDNHRAAEIARSITAAVNHAHSKNILHRDIKPANILFDENDKPMIADFGMVKWMSDLDGQTATATGLGTPAYMSPEQAQDAASSQTTTDIYGIGVTLYAMLTGRAPFTSHNPVTTLKQILDEHPLPPIKSNPDVDIDLNTICCKCIEKFPADRYQDCGQLEADLNRYLNHQPIHALPASTTKRIRYWVWRNPYLFGATAAAVTILVFGIFGIVLQWQVAVRNAQIADANASKADANLQTARKAVDEYFDVVSQDPELRNPNHLPLRKKLLARCLDYYAQFVKENKNDESLQFAVGQSHLKIGRINAALGEQQAALNSFESASEILRECRSNAVFESAASADLAKSLTNLSTFQRRVNQDIKTALALQDEAIEIQSALVDKNQTQEGLRTLAKMYSQLSFLFRIQDKTDQRHEALKKSIQFHELANQLGPPDQSGFIAASKARMNLANLLIQKSNYEEATSLYGENLNMLSSLDQTNDATIFKLIADNITNLAICAQNSGNTQQATKSFEESKLRLTNLMEEFPNVVSLKKSLRIVLINHGNLQLQNSHYESAEENFVHSIRIIDDLLAISPDSLELLEDRAEDLKFLGLSLLGREKPVDALETHQKSLEIYKEILAKRPQSIQTREEIATAHKNIATVFVRQQKTRQAINAMKRSIDILEQLVNQRPDNKAYKSALQQSIDWLDRYESN